MLTLTAQPAPNWLNKVPEITALFWHVLTRPFGAAGGDLLSQPLSHGGLGLGTTGTSLVFLATILIAVFYMTARQTPAAA